MTRFIGLAMIALWAGCTTLGPIPTTTGLSAVPSGRPGVEAQVGFVPGYFLSAATREPTHDGNPTGQLLAVVEPADWLGTAGLVVGARRTGNDSDGAVEPFLGYRHRLGDDIALAVVGYGAQMQAAQRGASYRAFRLGGELALDARLARLADWFAIHGQAAASTTYVDASGTYCADDGGLGIDCSEGGNNRMVDGTVRGAFVGGTASLALDFGRLPAGSFHSLRLAVLGAAGMMPQVRDGMQTQGTRYLSLGLTLTVGFGSSH
jgi:hypothetical protein